MTPADLRDRIERARVAATRSGVVDPYVLALAALADLAEQRLVAQDMIENDAFSGVECGVAARRYELADQQLRYVLPLPVSPSRLTGALRTLGDDPPRGWEYGVHARLPAVVLPRPSWWRRAWRWLWR